MNLWDGESEQKSGILRQLISEVAADHVRIRDRR